MRPAKFKFGSDFDGAGECLCAVLDDVHLCGGGDSGFTGFGYHPCCQGDGGCLLLLLYDSALGVEGGCCQSRGVVLGGWFVVVVKFCSCFGPHLEKKPKQCLLVHLCPG